MMNQKDFKHYTLPDEKGHFGIFGGNFSSETLIDPIKRLEIEYEKCKNDKLFEQEFQYDLKHYVGRETPLYFAENLTNKIGGANLY